MAPTFVLAFATLVGAVLSRHGVIITTDDLVTTITSVVTIVAPVAVMVRQYWTGRSTLLGMRPTV